ncbi:MAG TPA: hypothetical protein ENJ02_00650 [Chloroflexi bacterium]|nr:hypothetical protein [Chloroflexota bacterium]
MPKKNTRLQTFINSKYGVNFALWLGRTLPPRTGYRVADFLAALVSRQRHSSLVRAIRLNQWVVHDKNLPDPTAQVRAVLRHAGVCIYDLYHHFNDPEAIKRLTPPTEGMQGLIAGSRSRERGALVVAAHTSNFDVALLGLAFHGMEGQVLSYGEPTGGYEIQNRIRASTNLRITPVGAETLQEAVAFMRQGGYVYTAVDRPSRRYRDKPLTFFGHPAALPAGYVKLALEAGVPILPISAHQHPDGHYEVFVAEPVFPDQAASLRHNAERVLARLEDFIRRAPEQWLMYYPVWPDLFAEMP